MDSAATTETLTDSMIEQLRTEAAAADDAAMVTICSVALSGQAFSDGARQKCADAITSARAMNDDQPLVRVVAR